MVKSLYLAARPHLHVRLVGISSYCYFTDFHDLLLRSSPVVFNALSGIASVVSSVFASHWQFVTADFSALVVASGMAAVSVARSSDVVFVAAYVQADEKACREDTL